jgi:hypothetical protein
MMILLLIFSEAAFADNPTYPPASCKIKKADLVSAIEDYRKNQVSYVKHQAYFMYCKSARSVLEKYVVDPDPLIRDVIANFLCCDHSKFNLLLLVTQIEAFPLRSHYARHQLSFYDPRDFLKMKTERRESLRKSLIEYELERARTGEDQPSGESVVILKILAAKDEQARQFLVERGKL